MAGVPPPGRRGPTGGSVQAGVVEKHAAVLAECLTLIKNLAADVQAIYGEIRNTAYPGWDLPFDLKIRLPDVPWVSIYGLPYIQHFGLERILTAPFNSVAQLSEGLIWAQATPSAFEEITESRKKIIREHLGDESFMSGGRWRYKTGSAPVLPEVTYKLR